MNYKKKIVLISLYFVGIFSQLLTFADADVYDGYQLLRITPRNDYHASLLRQFVVDHDHKGQVDIWSSPSSLKGTWTLFLSPSAVDQWNREFHLEFNNSEVTDLTDNLKHDLYLDRRQNQKAKRRITRSVFYNSFAQDHQYYRNFESIKSWLEMKASKSSLATLSTIGRTVEDRPILMLKISTNDNKPIIWIDAGIHAREWIAPATALYLIDMLLGDSSEAKNLLSKYQFYIVPLVNPDGYEYTHTTARLWRKNRSRVDGSYCIGVDLNRNFPYKWGGGGSSDNPCDPIYRGSDGNSELETQAMTGKLVELKNNVHLFLTLHSYGQYIMMPYGHAILTYPRSYQKMIEMSHEVASTLRRKYGRYYMIGSSADVMYAAAGGSGDFAAATLKIPHTATIELPDRGRYGFLLPPTYIVNVGLQIWDVLNLFASRL